MLSQSTTDKIAAPQLYGGQVDREHQRSAMERLFDLAGRHRRWILIAWGVALLVAAPFSLRQSDHLTSGGGIAPGSQSSVVDASIKNFPSAQQNQQGVLIRAPRGIAGRALAHRAKEARLIADTVQGVSAARLNEPETRTLAKVGLAFVPVTLAGNQDSRVDAAVKLRKRLGVGSSVGDGPTRYLVGQDSLWAALHELQKKQLASAELVGFPVTLIILFATFGALAAAVLPLALAAITVTLTGGVVYFLSQVTPMSTFVTNAASMIGIGVAIDYSLFILARYRQELSSGSERDAARRIALASSGRAVIFSGVTVLISLLGILLVNSTLLRSMAFGMIVVVALSVLAAVTLLPALIDLFGRRVDPSARRGRWLLERLRIRTRSRLTRDSGKDPGKGAAFWTRWTHLVMRRPVLSVVVATTVLIALALPVLKIHLDESAIAQFPRNDEARNGTLLAAHAFGPGRLGPVQELVTFKQGAAGFSPNASALGAHLRSVRELPQVASVDPLSISRDGKAVLVSLIPRSSPEAMPARQLVGELRGRQTSGSPLSQVATVNVGGNTALPQDFASLIGGSMWKIALFVLILSYFVLLLMLRSLILPLKAIVMTALSVMAAYGVLVAVFQMRWLDGVLGYHSPGYVEASAPPLLLALVFGLSMDYEVFLLSRVREFAQTGVDSRTAVARGLIASAGTITSAALIMVSVFAAFGAVGEPTVKQVGVGLAVAIALDATVVRLVLVPATMELLGKWNWWLPSALERWLPRIASEAHSSLPPPIGFTKPGAEASSARTGPG